MENLFLWTKFYAEFANALLKYKNNRSELLQLLKEIFNDAKMNFPFKEKGKEDYDDICPFTVFGSFNKGIKDENRIALITNYANRLEIESEIPTEFSGIPVLMNLSAWFFAYKDNRGKNDIDNLWELFEKAINYADESTIDNKNAFVEIYNKVVKQKMIKWNITMGLYWIRPYTFINLDSTNRAFLTDVDNMPHYFTTIFSDINKGLPDGVSYLFMCEQAKNALKQKEYEYHSFPELSYYAWSLTQNNKTQEETIDSDVKETSYWLYSPGDNASMWEEFYKLGIMGIGWDEIGCSIKDFKTKQDIKNHMKKVYGAQYSYKNDAHCLWQFANEIKVGDVVFAKKGLYKIIGKGIVKSDYIYDANRKSYLNIRKIEWQNIGEWDHPKGQAAMKTLTNITPYNDYVQELLALFEEEIKETQETEIKYPVYTKDDFLEEVYMDEECYDTLVELLNTKYNIILQGAPGVGKTFAAKRIAYSIMGEKDTSRVSMIQFHQSYSYEDFIQGYRPVDNGFKLESGVFYKFCKAAEIDNERPYFFIIDEINRGNLSKIFGELLMLIESDKRGEKLKLLYKDEWFTVPKNIRIIGLMNTADRSLAIMDYALRRRFAFYDFVPAFSTEGFRKYLTDKNNEKLSKLIDVIEELNVAIENDDSLGEGFKIGHSYFCTTNTVTDNWLRTVVEYEIIPMLKEYWFDEPSKIRDWSIRLRSAIK